MTFDHPLLPQVDRTLSMAAARRSEGKSPFIGYDAADLDSAVEGVADSVSVEVCAACSR